MLSFRSYLRNVSDHYDIIFASGVLCILFILLFPIPSIVVDLLLSVSVTFSILILITVLFLFKPLDLNSFPSILLLSTMLRLALNIASTRLILLNGHKGTAAAGYVIESFGQFVMQGSVVIGLIVFIILTIINFIVITKGSGRIAEVSARFSLDAMPGKQMSIDADLSAGIINEEAAQKRRRELEEESTFFGAMDGASKFVRGDAIAGILITFINFIGGMVIGILSRGMDFDHAVHTYTILTIGDGLVSQIPALIISIAAGLLVTKSGVTGSTDKAIFSQIGQYPRALGLTSFFLILIGIIPGMPFIPFFFTSVSTACLSYSAAVIKRNKVTQEKDKSKIDKMANVENTNSQKIQVDDISIELGSGLLVFASQENNNNLSNNVQNLRKQIAKDLGFVIPSVHIQDNFSLDSNQYLIKIKDIECARGNVYATKILVISPIAGQAIDLPGEATTEPAFGLPAVWIEQNLREEALLKNYTVVDPQMVIITHLTESIKNNITELVSYSSVQRLLDNIGEHNKRLVNDIVPAQVSISIVQKVLQNLLAENISIKDLPTIIESIADSYRNTQNITTIIESVRVRLNRQISAFYSAVRGYIPVITLSPDWEQTLSESIHNDNLAMSPDKLQEFVKSLRSTTDYYLAQEENVVLMTSPSIRPYVYSIIDRINLKLPVISQNEIHHRYQIKNIGQVS